MKLFGKIFSIILFLAFFFIVQFELFGHHFDALFSQAACVDLFLKSKSYGWAIGIVFLVSDLLLPIPATGIMAALGNVYGVLLGGIFSAIGSITAGLTGYGTARFIGTKGSRFLASEEELARFQDFFDRWGGAAVIVSRMLPILPEVVSILAGIARMHFIRFFCSLLLGTMPVSFLFAWIGAASRETPVYGMIVAIVIPLLLWPLFLRIMSLKNKEL